MNRCCAKIVSWRACALAPALLLPLPAAAWDDEVHVAIVRAAIGISAAAEARLPLEQRDVLLREVKQPDFADKECRYHSSWRDARDPALEAERLYNQLVDPGAAMRPYQRVQAIGRFLHYVADSVVPQERKRPNAEKEPNFFANRDFAVFREARELSLPLGVALRARGAETAWVNANPATQNSFMFRLAVNAVADALLLLPPRAEAGAPPDSGPVLFLVNRIDNGSVGHSESGWQKSGSTISVYDEALGGFESWEEWEWVPGRYRGEDLYKPNLMEKRGVQLLELVSHVEGRGVKLRALFFNNSAMCADRVTLKAGSWTWSLPGKLPGWGMASVEIAAPADVLQKRLQHKSSTDNCEGGRIIASKLSAAWRKVYGNGGGYPRFDAVLAESDLSSATATSRVNLTPRR